MAVVSVVKLTELEGAKRFDSEYYQPMYLEVSQKLNEYKPLKEYVVKILHPVEIKRIYTNTGIQILLAQNISHNYLDLSVKAFMPDNVSNQIAKNKLAKNDVVMTRSGVNYGDTAYYDKEPPVIYACADCLVICPKGISGAYLSTFLNTKIGMLLVKRGAYGSAQPHIAPAYLKSLRIPRFSDDFEGKIEKIIEKSKAFFKESYNFYSEAENLLLSELGLKDFKPKYELSYTANLSNALGVHRVDAEYFQPVYEKVIKHFTDNFKTEKLRDIVSFINHGKQPYYVIDGEIPVLIQKHLGDTLLSLSSDILDSPDTPRTNRKFVESYPEYKLKFGDVLFYSVGAYLGRANIVLEDFEAVPASFITLIRTKPEVCNSTYLAVFLNSEIGQLQSSRWKSASAQQYIYPKEIKEFVIPILPDKTQQKIASLVQQSHESRKKAKGLLDIAKRALEIAVEEGAEPAKRFLKT